MAITTHITCSKCKQSKNVSHSVREYPRICGDCARAERDDAKQAHFAELDKLPIEQRIRKLEEFVYEYRHTDHTPWQLKKIG